MATKRKTPAAPASTPQAEPQPITVVIPYRRDQAQGIELLMAVRSWYRHASFPFRLIVIGDAEDWMDTTALTLVECPPVSPVPSVDTLHKLWTVIRRPDVTSTFIWSNDDIYLLRPIGMEHIALPKVRGILNPKAYNGHYAEAMRHTIELLQQQGLPTLDYGTHTPLLLQKDLLATVLPPEDPAATTGTLWTSLYFNHTCHITPAPLEWKTDPFLLPIVTRSPDPRLVASILPRKVFLNNARSGYSPWLEQFLTERYPDACPAER